jgi:DnaJ like chaperone protein
LAQWGKWLGWTTHQVQALANDYEPKAADQWRR